MFSFHSTDSYTYRNNLATGSFGAPGSMFSIFLWRTTWGIFSTKSSRFLMELSALVFLVVVLVDTISSAATFGPEKGWSIIGAVLNDLRGAAFERWDWEIALNPAIDSNDRRLDAVVFSTDESAVLAVGIVIVQVLYNV